MNLNKENYMITPITSVNLTNKNTIKNFKQNNAVQNSEALSEQKIKNLKKKCIICGSTIAAIGGTFAAVDYKNQAVKTNNYLLRTILLGLGWGAFITGTYFLEKNRILNAEKESKNTGNN